MRAVLKETASGEGGREGRMEEEEEEEEEEERRKDRSLIVSSTRPAKAHA